MNRSMMTRALYPLLMIAGLVFAGAAGAAESFSTADQAADAFVQAVKANDQAALAKILGTDWKSYIPTEGVGRDDVDTFITRYAEAHKIVESGGKAHLAVGNDAWVLPIPLVKQGSGWEFDAKAAHDEIITRHIGANELAAVQAALAYYDAQRDYAAQVSGGIPEYAQKFVSSPGKHDGLYWPSKDGEPESPLGELYASATHGDDYHGYHFRILTAQGPSAPGGAYDYMSAGHMRNGFALIAWPSHYGETGVMSFIVSHDGEVFEKDLGKDGGKAAQAMTRFDPDSSWKETQQAQ
ncbi:DUF2950 domain-containing protein [Dyella sp. 20L07]|uniref:DUF2950 domain-containing protein n=1 Tax=Dyella sp. 20L07 TaxID=3384240 RepID=UPI003D28B818